MMMLRSLFLVFLFIPSFFTEIGDKNAAIRSAAKNYQEGQYEAAIADQLKLTTDFQLESPSLTYNLALSYHKNKQIEEATRTYLSLLSSPDSKIASFGSNQHGVILTYEQNYKEALEAFKYALIKNPENEEARFNFELLSRWLQQNPDQQQQQNDQNKEDQQQDQENQDQQKQNQEKKDGEGDEETKEDEASESQKKEDKTGEKSQQEKESEEASDLESDLSDREKRMEKLKEKLKEMNLTPEQAAQILEAMNAADLRYIQQNKKKPTKRPSKGLPEW